MRCAFYMTVHGVGMVAVVGCNADDLETSSIYLSRAFFTAVELNHTEGDSGAALPDHLRRLAGLVLSLRRDQANATQEGRDTATVRHMDVEQVLAGLSMSTWTSSRWRLACRLLTVPERDGRCAGFRV
jgi:hypothetical protein